jgi:hypothetical protein
MSSMPQCQHAELQIASANWCRGALAFNVEQKLPANH